MKIRRKVHMEKKNSLLFQRFSGAIPHFKGVHYTMYNLLAMALISSLMALNSLFVVTL
jgi:hypothetical protein